MEAASAAPGPREFLWLVAAGFLLLGTQGSVSPDTTSAFPSLVSQESVKIKVSTLGNNGDNQDEQVVLNITYVNGQLIIVQEEVTEIDGKQVQQDEVTEIDILVKDIQVLRHTNYTVSLKESMLYSIPRENDVLFTFPNIAGKDIESPLQTTSHYLLRQAETTVDEESMPGKLPETPLRAEPPSSYKVMCQWVEDLRRKLCKIWLQSFPVFFSLMEVIVLGVTGAVFIIKTLKIFCPSCEPRGILQLDSNALPVVAISLHPDILEKTDNVEKYLKRSLP